jgi:hypothetical protein
MKTILAIGLASLLLPAFPAAATATPQCGPRDYVAAELGKRFHEDRQGLGLAGEASVIELYVSDTGSWTLTSTSTTGITCVVAAGEAWQQTPRQVAGLES